jgi:NAD(P) transhydrogenase subunit alpha
VVAERSALLDCDLVLQVRVASSHTQGDPQALKDLRSGALVIGTCDPLGAPQGIAKFAQTGGSLCALELIPRITRAQAMDVLSSQATVAGYRAVVRAAMELPKMFPMMMTAAGTLAAARVLVIGAGVAGLQAIATARRLGAVVNAYDVRPATREQVESLGAKFVQLELETDQAEDQGGYARALGDEFYHRQRQLLAEVVAEQDVVITTAAIPGKPSPLLITSQAVEQMAAGGVIVDLAAERGGNCELSEADQRVEQYGVVILGPTNLPAEVPFHASQMFSNNVTKFILNLVEDGRLRLDTDDEIIRQTLICRDGTVLDPRIRQLLELAPLAASADAAGSHEGAAPPDSGSQPNPDAAGQDDDSPDSEGNPT